MDQHYKEMVSRWTEPLWDRVQEFTGRDFDVDQQWMLLVLTLAMLIAVILAFYVRSITKHNRRSSSRKRMVEDYQAQRRYQSADNSSLRNER